ncbi:hypothetical protein J7T55_003043 [Diaporthe amygdali]|uniref:uncharacterized protein n=1 Tax=Phomopsis amygdali TaxID=1214568 RepID=UPI0022FE7A63|nr:uncharacterized protein J7T55_003043 [Diaporthe amygdali]KAJ0122530.1 hypothetical protein J7T55_003043 [Diaporthe amygdali]
MSVGSMPKVISPFNGDHTGSGRGMRCAMKSHDSAARKQSLVAKTGGDEPIGCLAHVDMTVLAAIRAQTTLRQMHPQSLESEQLSLRCHGMMASRGSCRLADRRSETWQDVVRACKAEQTQKFGCIKLGLPEHV